MYTPGDGHADPEKTTDAFASAAIAHGGVIHLNCAVQGVTTRAGATGSATLGDLRMLLADHADYPHSICSHPDPGEHPLEQGATIASILMDLNARRLWIAAGHPCQAPYQESLVRLTRRFGSVAAASRPRSKGCPRSR